MKGDVFLLILASFVSLAVDSDGCSCLPRHPQEHFCTSDFVINARIKREIPMNETRTTMYKVHVRKEYKLSDKGRDALKHGLLRTAMDESMCGLKLEVGKVYVLSGRIYSLKAYVNLCNFAEKWEHLTRRQRRGFKVIYRHGCRCNITNCRGRDRRCFRHPNSCNWANECQTKEGICLRKANNSCVWNRNQALTTCLKGLRANNTTQHHRPIHTNFIHSYRRNYFANRHL